MSRGLGAFIVLPGRVCVCLPPRASRSAGGLPWVCSPRCLRAFWGVPPSCGVFQGRWHPQVTNCHLGTLRRVCQEQPCHQHPSSDNVHHGRPGALWEVSEALTAQLRSSSSSLVTHHLPCCSPPGECAREGLFLLFLLSRTQKKVFDYDNSHYSLCPLP